MIVFQHLNDNVFNFLDIFPVQTDGHEVGVGECHGELESGDLGFVTVAADESLEHVESGGNGSGWNEAHAQIAQGFQTVRSSGLKKGGGFN